MKRAPRHRTVWLAAAMVAGLALLTAVAGRADGWTALRHFFTILTDPGETQSFIERSGALAPLAFVAVQVLQVVLAPIPGELTGFVGGYLFGAAAGFCYSSAALTLGSLINFMIGRKLGRRVVMRLISAERFNRFDRLFHDRGVVAVFVLFLFPGFPKDIFCLFLGLTTLPIGLMVVLAAVGRMPGTLMLSLQGAAVFHRDPAAMVVVAVAGLAMAGVAYRFREPLARWAERFRRS